MKATKTSSIIFVIFMTALIVYMCQGDQSINGKYLVSVMPKTEITTEEEKAAMEVLYSAKIQYEFMDDGVLNTTTTIGEVVKTATLQWSTRGDSIFIDTERYKLEKMNIGYALRGYNVDLILEKY